VGRVERTGPEPAGEHEIGIEVRKRGKELRKKRRGRKVVGIKEPSRGGQSMAFGGEKRGRRGGGGGGGG